MLVYSVGLLLGFTKNGDSMLMAPTSRGFSIIVEYLLQHGADPNLANKVHFNPLAQKRYKSGVIIKRLANKVQIACH